MPNAAAYRSAKTWALLRHLKVTGILPARHIQGGGTVEAGEVVCDTLEANTLRADVVTLRKAAGFRFCFLPAGSAQPQSVGLSCSLLICLEGRKISSPFYFTDDMVGQLFQLCLLLGIRLLR